MTQERMTPHQPPKFCSVCGTALERVETETSDGFDVLTGEARPPYKYTFLQCPLHSAEVWREAPSGDWLRP